MTRFEKFKPGIDFIAGEDLSFDNVVKQYSAKEEGNVFNSDYICRNCPVKQKCDDLYTAQTGKSTEEDVEDDEYIILCDICENLISEYLKEEV